MKLAKGRNRGAPREGCCRAYFRDMTEDAPDLIEDSPIFANHPNRRPGGACWYRDRPDYDKTRAQVLEFLTLMLWEEIIYLRDGKEPEGTGISRSGRLENIKAKTSEYLTYTMKDLRPRGLWDKPLVL
jgi:hypothetical protein